MATILRNMAQNMKKKYFLDEEFAETLQAKQVYRDDARIVKKEYIYESTGARYSGEWKGGFRHGYGEMEWVDGARYEGQWCLGKAWGKGIF